MSFVFKSESHFLKFYFHSFNLATVNTNGEKWTAKNKYPLRKNFYTRKSWTQTNFTTPLISFLTKVLLQEKLILDINKFSCVLPDIYFTGLTQKCFLEKNIDNWNLKRIHTKYLSICHFWEFLLLVFVLIIFISIGEA